MIALWRLCPGGRTLAGPRKGRMRTLVSTVSLIALLVHLGCGGGTPTQPSPMGPSRINEEGFEVTGIVTDERGSPMPGALVTMSHWLGGVVQWPSVATDASGGYRISFTADPLGSGFLARAQVVADGYEEYWRSVVRSDGRKTFVENFRLSRITRITAGDSIVLSVAPDLGECRGWVAAVCAIVRITIPKAGRLTVDAVSTDPARERPPLEICCESGNERYGNPVTIPVAPGPELEMRIGLGQGISTIQSFRVNTSFDTF